MTERQMEIIISIGIEKVLGKGYALKAQQLHVGPGRLDLLVEKPDGGSLVIELKKGKLRAPHISQVLEYSNSLEEE